MSKPVRQSSVDQSTRKIRSKKFPRPHDVIETTILKSPNRPALALIRVGDTLDVEFRRGPPSLLVAMTPAGTAARAISCKSMTQIVDRLKKGERFVAEVLSIRQNGCRVRLQHLKSG